MSYVILDLEWNACYSTRLKRFVNEIIEFGAVRLDDHYRVTDTFSVMVKPRIGKRLNGKVKELTKITLSELKTKGVGFLTAAHRFSEFLADSTLMTWGTSDIHALLENYSYYTGDYHIPFLTTYCDLQEYCMKALDRYDEGNQMGLGVCAELLGVSFSEEEQHRAYADAYLSQKCLLAVRGKLPLESCVLRADEESFYDRMTFRSYFITDLTSPDISKSDLRFRCDKCGKPVRRVKKWRLHNKNFSAEFRCMHCGRSFIGRVSFKKKYDGVRVNKRIVEIVPKQKKKKEAAKKEAPQTE